MTPTITTETKRRLALGLPLNPQNRNRRRHSAATITRLYHLTLYAIALLALAAIFLH